MGTDVSSEVGRLLGEGKTPQQVRLELESQGFSNQDIAMAMAPHSSKHEDRNSQLLASREVLDRIGYGAATPQLVNILFWLAIPGPFVIFIIGLLNGMKTLLSVLLSTVLQEYNKVHKFSKNTISAAGIVFGFSFLLLSFGLLIKNIWLFSGAFIVGAIGIVVYGDLYHSFVQGMVKKERMSTFLRSMAHWGVLITVVSLIFAGYILSIFPLSGTPITLFGKQMQIYGYLITFEITAFAFILSGYITSFLRDQKDRTKFPFVRFLKEHVYSLRNKMHVFIENKYILLLSLASIVSGLLQILMHAYAGIAIYGVLDKSFSTPFIWLSLVYSIAIVASFSGPFFTSKIHRNIGLAPTLVFGTMLMAILPLVLVYNANVFSITAALAMHVVGAAITGFAQGLLAKKLMHERMRQDYYGAQSLMVVVPYILLVPILSWIAMKSLETAFLIVAVGLIFVVMPLYFLLVIKSQHIKL